jgi:SAM-dependent methyltransferase
MSYEGDLRETLANREKLEANQNLLEWYRSLFLVQLDGARDLARKRVLEIGSGMSPIKRFHPGVMTSDVLQLSYLDHVFDCHAIDTFDGIADRSLDMIILTNVLHHLKAPVEFLRKAHAKMKPGGRIVAVEPYFSWLSWFIYKYLHYEPVDFSITAPALDERSGPLSSANQALPYLVFFSDRGWDRELHSTYLFDVREADYFTGLSYFLTGGIHHRFPIPAGVYRGLHAIDLRLSRLFPRLWASFFILRLEAR